jgi:hypothetical protein
MLGPLFLLRRGNLIQDTFALVELPRTGHLLFVLSLLLLLIIVKLALVEADVILFAFLYKLSLSLDPLQVLLRLLKILLDGEWTLLHKRVLLWRRLPYLLSFTRHVSIQGGCAFSFVESPVFVLVKMLAYLVILLGDETVTIQIVRDVRHR